jgi:autoinducer 2-degrading protein
MVVVVVSVHVKVDAVESFRQATRHSAGQSRREPGVARFDVIQQSDDPTRFLLIEAYRTPDAVAAHKETLHYLAWRDIVAPMMAEPRAGVKYSAVSPDDDAW